MLDIGVRYPKTPIPVGIDIGYCSSQIGFKNGFREYFCQLPETFFALVQSRFDFLLLIRCTLRHVLVVGLVRVVSLGHVGQLQRE